MTNHGTISKFTIPITDEVTVTMPKYANILPFVAPGELPGTLTIWAEVIPYFTTQERKFLIIETGNLLPDQPRNYIGTALKSPFAWHLYEAIDSD